MAATWNLKLRLLSVKEFTIEPTEGDSDGREKLKALTQNITKIADFQGGGALEDECGYNIHWRLPLACYQDIMTFLVDQEHLIVDGIPEEHLRATTVHNVDGGTGYPSVEQLIKHGISRQFVEKLTDYQRGGVDFVLSRNGRGK
jgi:hypothetical protein